MGASKSRFPVLKVDVAFEVLNGLCGMKRNVIVRLCGVVWSDDKKVKGIIGICGEHLTWRQHLYFIKSRPFDIPVSICPNPTEGCAFSYWPRGILRCEFIDTNSFKTVFNKATLANGVFQWTIQITYTDSRYTNPMSSCFRVGATPSDRVDQFYRIKDSPSRYGYAAFFFKKIIDDNRYYSGLLGVRGARDILLPLKVLDHSYVSIEADCAMHALSFFHGRSLAALKKVPCVVSGIRVPFRLLVAIDSSSCRSSFESVFFRRLPSTTPSEVVSTVYECEEL